jgi:pimeloyl-ACP methyl ester carboxylesterase
VTPTIGLSAIAATDTPALPPALSGERREIASLAGRLSFYTAGPDAAAQQDVTPLLLVHSINASASAYEVRPLYEHYRQTRPVYAIDLPGYGFSERSDRPYLPRLMTDALHAVVDEMQRVHGPQPIDVLGVSLSSEYAARAATETPAQFRSVALISPTAFDRRAPFNGAPGSNRGLAWLRRFFTNPLWSDALFRALTRPSVIRFFFKKTWGSPHIDEGLQNYAVLTTQQPGAKHAPYWFISAYLFSADITRVYEAVSQPVWMVHGVRGDFVDYRYKKAFAQRPNWTFEVMPTGALPYFERGAEFAAAYDAFLSKPR